MDKERLKLVLEQLREEYEKEWRSVQNTILKHISEVRDIVEQHFQNNTEIDFETAREIYDKINAINDKASLFWIWPHPWGEKQMEIKNIAEKILNNKFCRDVLINAENIQLANLNNFKEKLEEVYINVKGVKIRTLSSWLTIFNPKLFIPMWSRVIKSGFQSDFGISIPETVGEFLEFTKIFKEVSSELGIENMLEVAFYLSKYKPKTEIDLAKVLSELKKEYLQEWNKIKENTLKTVGDIRKLVVDKIEQGSEFKDVEISGIIKLGHTIETLGHYMSGGFGKDRKAILNLLNNPEFREFVMFLKANDELSWDGIHDQLMKLFESFDKNNVKNIGPISIATWMAVIRPDYFFPGSLSEKLCSDVPELKEFNDDWWRKGDIEKLIKRLRIVKEAADSVGIDNMFEVAFYLSKYPEFKNSIKLKEVLLELKRKYHDDWAEVENEFMNKINQIKNIVEAKIERNQKFDEEEIEGILKLYKTVPQNCRFILRFIASRGINPKEVLLDFLNTEEFADLVGALKNGESDSVEAFYDTTKQNVYKIGHTTLTTWLAILRPDMFMPIWGYVNDPGTFPPTLLEDFKELKKFEQWEDLSGNGIFELLDVLRTAANDVGITNMFEAAFYLNKYEGRPSVEIPVNGRDDIYLIEMQNEIETILNSKKQLIFYGPPGTGKTWLGREYIKNRTGDNREYYEFVTFHPSYSYEEFVEGLKPVPAKDGVKFVVEDGIFKRLAIKAMCEILKNQNDYPELLEISENLLENLKEIEKGITTTKNNVFGEYSKLKKELWANLISLREELKSLFKGSEQVREYYLVIDEINRGDISKIFGELITLLEADKRLGGENQIFATLPYSKEPFAIPPNLYIIGTMNTADRSIALIDVALRRRFGFIEVMPSYRVLLEKLNLVENVESEVNAIEIIENWSENEIREDVRKLAVKTLYVLNQKIQLIYDRDHQIGHSYLLKLKNGNLETLRQIWYHEVIPLLQEYFYNDWERLKYLLGEFVDINEKKEFSDPDLVDSEDAKIYTIKELGDEKFIKAMLSMAKVKSSQSAEQT